MFGTIYSNRVIRKIITGFGSLFSNTTLVRFNNDGSEQQRLIVPVAFGEKEKYMQILEGDPLADKNISITLPQMSYDLVGIRYNPSRKLLTTEMNFAPNSTGGVSTQYNPVPYDFDFSLFIYVRNVEDGTQIVEQILPFFTPDYTLRLNLMPSMNIIKDIPVKLNSVEYEVNNTGPHDGLDTRTVIWTLNFTAQGYIFGPVNGNGHIIREAITNIYNWKNTDGRNLVLVLQSPGQGTFLPGELITQNSLKSANATAYVVGWVPSTHRLFVDEVEGLFVTNSPITGVSSGATFNLTNYEITPQIFETVIITPDPPNANIANNTGYIVTTTQYL